MGNAANREKRQLAEGDVGSRLTMMGEQGLIDPQQFAASGQADAISHMTPEAGNKALDEISARAEREQARQQAIAQATPKTPFEQWKRDNPTGTYAQWKTAASSGMTGPKTPFQLWQKDHPKGTAEQYASFQVSQRAAQAGATKTATIQAMVNLPDTTPLGYMFTNTAAYAKNADGTFSPVDSKFDPRATKGNYRKGIIGTVPNSEVVAFNQQQTALKGLSRMKQLVSSPEVAGHYIGEHPNLYTYLGKPAREVEAALDPISAARVEMASTLESDITNKAFTNRTIQAQLQRISDDLLNPHGTVKSTLAAIDEAQRLIQLDSNQIISRGDRANLDNVVGEPAAPTSVTTPPEDDTDGYSTH